MTTPQPPTNTPIDTDDIDKQLDRILWYPGLGQKEMYNSMREAIKALIANQVKQAVIKELKKIALDNWQCSIPELYLLDRIKELEQ